MTGKTVDIIRKELIDGNNDELTFFYKEYKDDVVRILGAKKKVSAEIAQDYFAESIIILRSNIISKKITDLKNIKSYLITTCSNLIWNEKTKEQKKVQKIRLLFKQNQYNYIEDSSIKEERIKLCKASLLSLSERCQKIIVSFYVHNTKLEDIATDLGLASKDVAKTLKARCYKTWRENINKM